MKKAVKIFAVLSAAAGLVFSSCSTDSGSSPKNESILEKDELDGKVLKRENHLTDATYGGYTVIQSYVFNDGECEYTKEQKGDEGSQIQDSVSKKYIYNYSYDSENKILTFSLKKAFLDNSWITTPQEMMQFRINSVSEAELKNKLTANDTFILAEDDENSLNNYHSYFEEAAKRFGENEFVPFKILVEEVEDDSTKRNLIWYKLPSKLDDANASFAYKEIESYPEYNLEFETVSCIFDKGADFMFNDKTDDEKLKNITGAFYIENDKIVVKSPVLALYTWNDDKEKYIISCEKISENINLDYVENSDGSYSVTPLNFPEILSSYNNKAFTVKNTNEPVSVTYSLITGE